MVMICFVFASWVTNEFLKLPYSVAGFQSVNKNKIINIEPDHASSIFQLLLFLQMTGKHYPPYAINQKVFIIQNL